MLKKPYLLFLGDAADELAAKTAAGVAYWRRSECTGQRRLPGCQADLGLPDQSYGEAVQAGAQTLLLGVANSGGFLSDPWIADLESALEAGLDIASGMHGRLNDIDRLVATASRLGRSLIDVRQPTMTLPIGTGRRRPGKRLLTVGTDCSVGKMYTALAIEKALHEQGVTADFRATGQTGIMITGTGVSVDAVVADFISGSVEWLAPANDPDHWDIIEGQGSLFHAAFAGVSMGLLHGAQADALVLCHEPTRTHMRGLAHFPLPSLEECVAANLAAARLTNPNARFIGASINTSRLSAAAARDYLKATAEQLNLACVDPVRDGVGPLIEALS